MNFRVRQCVAATIVAASVMIANASKATEPAPIVPAPNLCDIEGSDWWRIAHLRDLEEPAALKQAFIDLFLPEIRAVNAAIEADRLALEIVIRHADEAQPMGIADLAILTDLTDRYGTADLVELQLRVREVPEALALAQAALESGWGTSKIAQERLAFFGQTTGDGSTYIWYPSIRASIASYAMNLNTHRAYADFRVARAGGVDPWQLAVTLTKYSELGRKYVKKVHAVMQAMEPHAPGVLIASN